MPDVRLIDANAIDVNDISCFYSDECRLDDVQDLIDSQPTVDAVPLKHGKWVDYGNGVGMYCSECRHRIRYRNGIRETTMFSDGKFEFVQYASKNGYYNFCPKCGAKMDGDVYETCGR